MKTFLVSVFLFCAINSYSQDATKIAHIDSLVSSINKLNLQVYIDSSAKKIPDAEISMNLYLTTVFDAGILKKYQVKNSSSDSRDGISTPFIQSTTFYYDQGQLIKVEESRLQYENRSDVEWYYSNDTLLKYTGKDPAKANTLLANGKEYFKRIKWREKK